MPITFEEWCDVNYPRVERLERTLMGIAWDAAVAGTLPEEAKRQTMHTCPSCGYPHDPND